MEKKLIFVRHSAVEIDTAVPSREWRLSENGRLLAKNLAPQIASHNPTRIITSLEHKASETGQIIAATLGIPWQTAPNLHEHERSSVGYFEKREDFLTAVAHFFTRPNQLVFGDETANEARVRFDTAVRQLIAQYPADTLAIVTHGTILALLLAHHNPKLNTLAFWQSLSLPQVLILSLPTLTLLE